MSYATTADGVKLSYQVRGDGPPLVLLQGQANNHHWWDAVREDFAADGGTRRRHLAASAGHDSWDVLPSITAPTLVVHGTDDVFNPAANAPLPAGRIPGAGLRWIEGARHAYFEELRAVASPMVLEFLADRPLD
ncbi:hypothetical protein ACQEVF_26035 [Nonomuraea polychroma]|uniref:alpha/beta fold hydrolase n=1 Tax=Nonomuraea polychroma TaxID=46176 RepID=UPI003D91F4ED